MSFCHGGNDLPSFAQPSVMNRARNYGFLRSVHDYSAVFGKPKYFERFPAPRHFLGIFGEEGAPRHFFKDIVQ